MLVYYFIPANEKTDSSNGLRIKNEWLPRIDMKTTT